MKQGELRPDLHPRQSPYGDFIYPVFSRRSKGLSLGINLNLDQHCSFNCRYCQVERRTPPPPGPKPEAALILAEVRRFFTQPHDLSQQPVKDLALAGDGEPTEAACLPELLLGLLDLKKELALGPLPILLYTNGTGLDWKRLGPSLTRLTQEEGEIWFKLDFWDEVSYHAINQGKMSYDHLLARLIEVGTKVPVVLQACLFAGEHAFGPPQWNQWIQLMRQLLHRGVKIQRLLAYTLARPPADSNCKPLSDTTLTQIAEQLTSALPFEVLIYGAP